MSAVCGIIDFKGKAVSEKVRSSMMEKLKFYSFDDTRDWSANGVYFGCGLQFITSESINEVLPLYDTKTETVITADAIIDNREELFQVFKIKKESRINITDSELILMAYYKWGEDCPKYLIGDYSFAIWNEKKKELFCARDHVGSRTFYYYYSEELFAFCTVIKPIFEAIDSKVELNERWIADFLALEGVIQETECNETVYKNIFQLPPANSMVVNSKGLCKVKYWNPLEGIKPLRLDSDEEYDEMFKRVFFEAVHCRLRSSKEIGIMLSGGLDSGAIASVAAIELADQGEKKLKGYSSIPIEGYKDKLPDYCLADESEYIKELCKKYENIEVTYCRSEGKNSLSDMDYFIKVLEQPYKIIENVFWLNEIIKNASQEGCKVLLNGQNGNSTISYGYFFVHILTLFRQRKFIDAIKEVRGFCNLYGIKKYPVARDAVKVMLPYGVRKRIAIMKKYNYDMFQNVAVNPTLIKKWNVVERFNEKGFNQILNKDCDLDDIHESFMVNQLAFSQTGITRTKMSLAHGIIQRDPTRDKRVIEFCLSLPTEQFVRNGVERLIIRRALKGILPDKIRLNLTKRGFQSADKIQRLIPHWDRLYSEIENYLGNKNIFPYIDVDKLKNELLTLKDISEEDKWGVLHKFIVSAIFSNFINNYEVT